MSSRGKRFDAKCVGMIRRIRRNESTVRREVYRQKDPRSYHRLVQMVVENYDVLAATVRKCRYMEDDPEMGIVRCVQILDGRIKDKEMHGRFVEAMNGVELRLTTRPLFVRINTLRGGSEKDIESLLPEKTPLRHVYKVPKSKDIHTLDGYKEGRVVIQNIASCLPAYILDPEENSQVIDTCAAPGNKTSQLSMVMNNTGRIYAFEMDGERAGVLEAQMKKLGVTNTEVVHGDFTRSVPGDFKDVRYILCDPSCSGSGVHLGYTEDRTRIERLKQFQIRIVQHALRFEPERLVYSVCSIHKEEGEEVVEEILRTSGYELEDISGFWESDFSFDFPFSHKVIRSRNNTQTGTIGFFVALFVRRDRGESDKTKAVY